MVAAPCHAPAEGVGFSGEVSSPARVATWYALEVPWGKPVIFTRVETGIFNRGYDCENNQEESLHIIQGKTAKTTRIETGAFHRGQSCEIYQCISPILVEPFEVVALPCLAGLAVRQV